MSSFYVSSILPPGDGDIRTRGRPSFRGNGPARANAPRAVADWVAPDGRTFHLGLMREGVSGLAPDPVRPVILDGSKIVAVGPSTVTAIIRCESPHQCSFLLSTWLPVKAEPNPQAFRPWRDYFVDPPGDDEDYGFAYKWMSATDWLAVFRNFAGQFPMLVWSAAGLGILSGLFALVIGLEQRGQLATALQWALGLLVITGWIVALKGGLLIFLFFLALIPTWFTFIPPFAAFALPCALTWLLVASIGRGLTRAT